MARPHTTSTREQRAAWLQRLRETYMQLYGAIYLFHFEQEIGNAANPLAKAQHYTGFVEGGPEEIEAALANRWSEHGTDDGAKIMKAVAAKGVRWHVAKIILNTTKSHELDLKEKHKNARRWCPVCRGEIELGAPPVVVDMGRQRTVGQELGEYPSPLFPEMYAMFSRHAKNRRQGAQIRVLAVDWDDGLL